MDKSLLLDLQETTKALKAAIVRTQHSITALANVAKLGAQSLSGISPTIFAELRQLEADMQKFLKNYKDQLSKASLSTSRGAAKEPEQ